MSVEAENKSGINGANAARQFHMTARLVPAGIECWQLTEQMRHCADFCLESAEPVARKLRCLLLQGQVWCRWRDLSHDRAHHAMVYMLLDKRILTKRPNVHGRGEHIKFTPYTRGWSELVMAQYESRRQARLIALTAKIEASV